MNCYIDSSVILRYLLTGDRGLQQARDFDKTGCSELLFIECSRVLQRYRLEGELTDRQLEEAVHHFHEIYEAFHVFELGHQVVKRSAESFPTVIGTLDAIHLSTAVMWMEQDQDPLVLFTYDEQMRTCAHAMGIHTLS